METIADLPSHLPPAERTLPRMLRRQAALHGDRRLVEIGGTAWTFAETLDMAARFGGTLHAAGIRRGDHVAVICGNRAELLPVYLGCGWIGAVTVPINTASRGAQLAHILANSQAKLLVLQAEHAGALETLEIVPPSLRAIWLIGDAALPAALAPRGAFPRTGGPCAGGRRRAGRYRSDPLHLGHHRRLERRLLSARAIFLVGRQHRAPARRGRETTCC